MSVISGMDEVIAYIKSQDEKIKALETNEKVREEFIVDMKAEIVELKKGISKEGVEEAAKVIYNLLNESKKLQEENEKLKEDARTNLDYSVKYEKDLVKKDEEIAQLKEQIDELESEVLDSRESFNLQQQSDLFYCRGHIYCDPETGENMNRDKLFAVYKDCYTFGEEVASLREKNEWMLNEKAELKRENVKLKKENDKFTKMFDSFPNDMDIYSWDEKREMWRHDEDEVSDDEEDEEEIEEQFAKTTFK